MGIKWEAVKVGWTDGSADKSLEVVRAVVEKIMHSEKDTITLCNGDKEYELKLTIKDAQEE